MSDLWAVVTGEFTLARREGDQIVFLLNHRHYDLDNPKPVPWESEFPEPMRRALSGECGTTVGYDYRGEVVLAAYEPVAELDLGIVGDVVVVVHQDDLPGLHHGGLLVGNDLHLGVVLKTRGDIAPLRSAVLVDEEHGAPVLLQNGGPRDQDPVREVVGFQGHPGVHPRLDPALGVGEENRHPGGPGIRQ